MEDVAFSILNLGPEAVIVKGGTLNNEAFTLIGKDCLVIKGNSQPYWLESKSIDTPNLHGTGCTFSAAIASFLANKTDILDAVKNAKHYISNAIMEGSKHKIGNGKGPVHHFHAIWPEENFTQKAFLEIGPLYKKIQQHPFFSSLASGSLSNEQFAFYIQQHYLFLQDRAKAFSLLASKAPTQELADYLTELSKSSQQAAEGIFKKYNLSVPSEEKLQKTKACKRYTKSMLKTASRKTFNEGLVFLLPCSLLYQKVGETIESIPHCPEPYKLWIDTYSSPERRKKVEAFISIVNQTVARSSYQEIQNLKAMVLKASQFEYSFWNDVYQKPVKHN